MKPILFLIVLFVLSCNILAQSQHKKSPEEIYNEAYKSIVSISSFDNHGSILKTGSGVIISADGLIYTNFHVISESEKIEIQREGSNVQIARVAGISPLNDAAILKIEGNSFEPVIIDETPHEVGETVYALGNPVGLTNTFSNGILSSLRLTDGINHIQYTASISHGSSGGALLNSEGRLIGITSSTREDGQNLNFAIPVGNYTHIMLLDYNDTSKINIAEKITRLYQKYLPCFPGRNSLIHDYSLCIEPCKCSFMLLSDIYTKAQINDTAAIFLTKAILLDSTDKMLYKMRADAYSAYHKVDSAIADYGRAIQIDSEFVDAYRGRAYLYEVFQRDYKKAISDYEKILIIKPDYSALYIWMADDYLELKDTVNVLKCLSKSVIFYDDKDGSAYYKRACIYRNLNNTEAAISDLTYAISDYDSYAYRFERAVEYTKNKQYDFAKSDYLEILKTDSKNAEANNNLAYCYMDDNDFDNAFKYFTISLRYVPKHADSFLGLAVLSYRQGKIKNAKEYMYSAMKIKSELEYGSTGLKKMEESGNFWEKSEKKDMIKIFRLMGISKSIEKEGEDIIFKKTVNHLARSAMK